jgi:chromosome segregation ATPase
MSKLIITGVDENGKITYVEGEEVVTSVGDLENRIKELRGKISLAKSTNLELVEKNHLSALERISADYESSLELLKTKKEEAIVAEAERYEIEKSQLATAEEIEVLEREEAKLSLILGGLRAQVTEEVAKEESVEEVTEVVEETVEPVAEEPEAVQSAAESAPRRIIF